MKQTTTLVNLKRIAGDRPRFQLAAICMPVCLLFCTAAVYDFGLERLRIRSIVIALGSILITLLMVISAVIKEGNSRNKSASLSKKTAREHVWLIVTLILAVILLVPQVEISLMGDSSMYYYGFQQAAEFNGSFRYLLYQSALAGHLSQGFCLLNLWGYLIDPLGTFGLGISKLLYYLIALYCLYRLVLKVCSCCHPAIASLLTLLLTCNPYILGMFPLINLDFGLGIAFIYLIYSLICNKGLIFICSSILLVFTKEPGVILLLGAGVGYLLFLALEARRNRKPLFNALIGDDNIQRSLVACFFIIAGLAIVRVSAPTWDPTTANSLASSSVPSGFKLDLKYIALRLYTLLIYNLNWLYVLIAILAVLYKKIGNGGTVSRGRHFACNDVHSGSPMKQVVLVVSLSVSLYVVFCCVYWTYNLPRYSMASTVLLTLLDIMLLASISGDGTSSVVAVSFIAIAFVALLLGQSFYSIDPFSKVMKGEALCGVEGERLYPPALKNTFFASDEDPQRAILFNNGMLDMAIYNGQITRKNETIDRALEAAGYHGDEDIILWTPDYITRVISSLNGELNYVEPSGQNATLDLCWDLETRTRKISQGGDNERRLRIIDADSFSSSSENGELADDAIWLVDPFSQRGFAGENITTHEELEEAVKKISDYLSDYYEIGAPIWIDSMGQHAICAYRLEKK